jgi:hypothetical protein
MIGYTEPQSETLIFLKRAFIFLTNCHLDSVVRYFVWLGNNHYNYRHRCCYILSVVCNYYSGISPGFTVVISVALYVWAAAAER